MIDWGRIELAQDWNEYQEEAAEFFRSLGFVATTNVPLQGVRTSHDVDVHVQIELAGFQAQWIIECKFWKSAVTKLHVMALREIVSDLGADRGIILCEAGFQSGAVDAAKFTNVQVTSLEALTSSSREAVHAIRLRDLFDRAEACRVRYWDLSKSVRIEYGLRPDLSSNDFYSGQFIVEVCSDIIGKAFRGVFPISVEPWDMAKARGLPANLATHEEVFLALEPLLLELEGKIEVAESSLKHSDS